MTYFSDYEKHHSEDTKQRSIFVRLFILKYLNTAVVFLISSDQRSLANVGNLSTDFNLSWYESVGVLILLVQIGK